MHACQVAEFHLADAVVVPQLPDALAHHTGGF